jgi:hypothetical protein
MLPREDFPPNNWATQRPARTPQQQTLNLSSHATCELQPEGNPIYGMMHPHIHWGTLKFGDASPYTGVPQSMGMHPHILGMHPQYSGMHPHILGYASIWGCKHAREIGTPRWEVYTPNGESPQGSAHSLVRTPQWIVSTGVVHPP